MTITPLPDLAQVRRQLDLIDDALGKGARVVNRGGGDSCQTLLLPAVLHPVVPGMRLFDEEQWGPVVPFTGRKDSAEGTLPVSDALRVFSIRTLVAAKEHPDNRALISRIVRERRSSFLNTDFIL